MAFMVAWTVKNLPARRETWVCSLGWEDPLEEGMATHSSILAWRIQWTEEPGWLLSMGSQRVGVTSLSIYHYESVCSGAIKEIYVHLFNFKVNLKLL